MNKEQLIEKLEELEVEIPEEATAKELKKLLDENKPKEPEEEEEKKEKTVKLYDQNENSFLIPESQVEEYLKKGFRKELPKKVKV